MRQMVRASFVRLVHASVPVWPVIPARAPLGLERVLGMDDDLAHRVAPPADHEAAAGTTSGLMIKR
jgi:hypothetical protein